MSVSLSSNAFDEVAFVKNAWVDGNITTLQEARVVVLLEDHTQAQKTNSFYKHLLERHFSQNDLLLIEEPRTAAFARLKTKIQTNLGLEVQPHQVGGWDDPKRWEQWPLYVKLLADLEGVKSLSDKESIRQSFQTILMTDKVGLVLRELAMRDLDNLSARGLIENQAERENLIAKIQCLALQRFRKTTFPKSQESLIQSVTSALQEKKTIWIIAGRGHGDPGQTKFPLEVARLMDLISRKPFVVLNPTNQ